jgi:hypothetical protein
MSKADKMFEELGYEKEENLELQYIRFRKFIFENEFQDIIFDLEHNLLNFRREDINFYRTITAIISIKELQAINEKIKELRLE